MTDVVGGDLVQHPLTQFHQRRVRLHLDPLGKAIAVELAATRPAAVAGNDVAAMLFESRD